MNRIRPFTLKAIRGSLGLVNRCRGRKASTRLAVCSGAFFPTIATPIGLLLGLCPKGQGRSWMPKPSIQTITDAMMDSKVVGHNTHLTAFRHSHYDPPP